MYDQFKINWCKFRLIPRYDPGQSGVTLNAQPWIITACDPTQQVTTPTFAQVAAFDNSKCGPLLAGKEFDYTFSPKVINTLAAGNAAVNQSDWLILSPAGLAATHGSMLYDIKTLLTTSVREYDYVIEINFSVRAAS